MRVKARSVISSRSDPSPASATSRRVVLLPMSMQPRITGVRESFADSAEALQACLTTMPSSTWRHALAGVDRLLEALEDVLPADHHHRVDPAGEQRHERLAADPVALVLEPVHLDEVRGRSSLSVSSPARAAAISRPASRSTPVSSTRLLHRRLDLVEAEHVGGLLGVVDHVVQRRGQRVDVLAVERGHRGGVELVEDVVGDPVALLLELLDLAAQARVVGPVAHQAVELAGGGSTLFGRAS